MKIIGITRVRNEMHIIKDVLDHVSKYVHSIYAFDDFSTDQTYRILSSHPKVKNILRAYRWETNPQRRAHLEGIQRQAIYNLAFREENPDWIYYFDGDEFVYEFPNLYENKADAYKLRLFDFYITESDKDKPWRSRQYMGPEYRDITMIFKPHKNIIFTSRVPKLPNSYKILREGFIRHYGKAISIQHWEETCDYYINHRHPEGKKSIKKWTQRKGKAVHSKSDFGADLITWDERNSKAIPLVDNQI